VTDLSRAVFLSYASQDAPAAQRICEALSAGGIEVWFDRSELRGGDAWDDSIRRQIKNCALFIPVISKTTHDRDEGYFRLEWKLAVDRCHLMAADKTFLLPVVIDDARDDAGRVPERFREVQWTRLPGGETPQVFVDRVRRLLSPAGPRSSAPRHEETRPPLPATPPAKASAPAFKHGLSLAAVLILGVVIYFAIDKPWVSKPSVSSSAAASNFAPTAFTPPLHSIAVLPFINMSGDKEQGYFSEGLTEELLNSLTQINGLQVAGPTSAFSFQGKDDDLATIARKLNVGAILEGSVRRSGQTIRVTAQLINTATGFQVWSKSYDRDLGDVLKLQTEIATDVAGSLKVTLLGDVSAKIELGGTRNPAAFDAYLRASKVYQSGHDTATDDPIAIAGYTEAIRLDHNYALAYAGRAVALTTYSAYSTISAAAAMAGFQKAQADARQAIVLAPELAEAHAALAMVLVYGGHDFTQANEEYERALALAPGNAEILRASGEFAAHMGHFDAGIAATRRAVVLDPLDRDSYTDLGVALYAARRYGDAAAAFAEAINLDPQFKLAYGRRGLALYELGDLERARASCEIEPDDWNSQWCLAMVYNKLDRHSAAEAELAKLKAASGDDATYQYATIYAQWGDRPRALEWLDTAMRLGDPGLQLLKTDPLLDPLRNEPRFQALLQRLKFPTD
jgi:TolB-like protein/tetratricopeptide (TPR) repeat protein